jgi:hypothetical protein
MAFYTGGGGVVDRMAISAGGATMIEAVYPAACFGVIQGGIPIARSVTLGAGCAELSGMGLWLGMAGKTIGWGPFENIIYMALGTGDANMRAS